MPFAVTRSNQTTEYLVGALLKTMTVFRHGAYWSQIWTWFLQDFWV